MDSSNKPMSRFDKMYWAAFAGAAVFLIVVNGRRYFTAKDPPTVCKCIISLVEKYLSSKLSTADRVLESGTAIQPQNLCSNESQGATVKCP
jgi:hypothetical protein